jgi:hypothetical protein
MKASLLYRVSSILLVLFAIGHTLGFRQIDPTWGVDSLVQSMKSIHFNANGANRTYWEFFVGFGLFVTVLMLFASIIAWQFGGLPSEVLAVLSRGIVHFLEDSSRRRWRLGGQHRRNGQRARRLAFGGRWELKDNDGFLGAFG